MKAKSKKLPHQVDPDKGVKYYLVWHTDIVANHAERICMVVKGKNVHAAYATAKLSLPAGQEIVGINYFSEEDNIRPL